MNTNINTREVIPSASRLVMTLRDVGYDFKAAVADLVDNSIAAKSTQIEIDGRFKSGDPWIRIVDNGHGMSPDVLDEALRYGSRRERYAPNELGKFGLGLKTASHSQCRKLIVATKQQNSQTIEAREHDIDHFVKKDKWEIKVIPPSNQSPLLTEPLQKYGTGTVILWKNLDRMLLDDYKNPSGHWVEAKLRKQMEELEQYLSMVFHRFLTKDFISESPFLKIYIRKAKVEPWDPFCREEPHTEELVGSEFKIPIGGIYCNAYFTPYVLPNSHNFSTQDAYNRAGLRNWTALQGLWIYRSNRLIQDGGWSSLVTSDEKTKYARVALEFFPEADDAFGIDIAKMRVKLPATLRQELKGPIATLLRRAKELYNAGAKAKSTPANTPAKNRIRKYIDPKPTLNNETDLKIDHIGKSIEQAAHNIDENETLYRIQEELKRIDKRSADALGW